ncbi:MAG TPA: DUF4160 domain-containing protein [bacterium]|nr:DUF4160 domain-containing protein [bacterium]
MGKLLILSKYVFLVFSADINEKRKHIHITDKKGNLEKLCKYWFEPEIVLEYNYGFNEKELNKIKKLIKDNFVTINDQLDKFFSGKPVKSIKKDQ